MAAFYMILKVTALLAVIIIPLIGPKKKKAIAVRSISKLAVNENGYLENFTGEPAHHHHVQ
jgi:hypothetical protein